jgi:hypothetical protein
MSNQVIWNLKRRRNLNFGKASAKWRVPGVNCEDCGPSIDLHTVAVGCPQSIQHTISSLPSAPVAAEVLVPHLSDWRPVMQKLGVNRALRGGTQFAGCVWHRETNNIDFDIFWPSSAICIISREMSSILASATGTSLHDVEIVNAGQKMGTSETWFQLVTTHTTSVAYWDEGGNTVVVCDRCKRVQLTESDKNKKRRKSYAATSTLPSKYVPALDVFSSHIFGGIMCSNVMYDLLIGQDVNLDACDVRPVRVV